MNWKRKSRLRILRAHVASTRTRRSPGFRNCPGLIAEISRHDICLDRIRASQAPADSSDATSNVTDLVGTSNRIEGRVSPVPFRPRPRYRRKLRAQYGTSEEKSGPGMSAPPRKPPPTKGDRPREWVLRPKPSWPDFEYSEHHTCPISQG